MGNGNSYGAAVTANGRFVAFHSVGNNFISGTGAEAVGDFDSDVFRKDIFSGEILRVSTAQTGEPNGPSSYPVLSADGRYVSFQSSASNLTNNDTQMCGAASCSDIFIRDIQTGLTSMVSQDSNGVQGNNSSSRASISDDGRYVAFQSSASNLVDDDANQVQDIFVKDNRSGITRHLPMDKDGWSGCLGSSSPVISGDGSRLMFASDAFNLIRLPQFDQNFNQGYADTNQVRDIYATDLQPLFDNISPAVAYKTPTGWINTTSPVLTASYDDPSPSSGIDEHSAILSLNNSNETPCSLSPGAISCPTGNLSETHYDADIAMSDNLGNVSHARGSVDVDTTAPAIVVEQPSGAIDTRSVIIAATYSDFGSGVNVSLVRAQLDGEVLTGCSFSDSNISCLVEEVPDGLHTFSISVNDNAGDTGYALDNFSVDVDGPVISQVSPSGPINTSSTTITANYTDKSSGINAATASVYLDGGSNHLAGCTVTAESVSCPASGLASGPHTCEVMVMDRAGNQSIASGSFSVVTCSATKPSLTLKTPITFWASYADYTVRKLSVTWTVGNTGASGAHNVQLISSKPDGKVTLLSKLPASIGAIAAGSSGSVLLQYKVPVGYRSFHVLTNGSGQDECETATYFYGRTENIRTS